MSEPLLGVDDLEQVNLDEVEAALAFLDECSSSSSSPPPLPPLSPALLADPELGATSWVLDPSEEAHAGGNDAVDIGTRVDAGAKKKPRKRVREYDPAVEKLRRQRKRFERQDLVRQAKQLQQQLAAVKKRSLGHRATPSANGGTNDPLQEQLCSLAKARELNQKLRAALSAHVDVRECVCRLFSELSKTTDDVVREAKGRRVGAQVLTMQPMLFSASSQHVSLARTARSMQKVARLAIESVFGSTNRLEVSKSTRVRPLDGGSGSCVEVVMTTPLNCGLRDGIQQIRNWIIAKRYRTINEVSYSSLVVQNEDQLTEAHSNVNFGWPSESKPWHCVSITEMREEADRLVTVGTMLTAHPSGSVRFREEAWTLVTRSPVDPLHKTVVRMCYRLTTEHDPGTPALPKDDDETQKGNQWRGDSLYHHAHRRLVQRKTTKMADLQCTLLRETGQGELCSLVSLVDS